MRKLPLLLIIAALIQSCVTPKLTNLHRGKYTVENLSTVENILKVNVKIIPLPKPPAVAKEKPKYFFDLNDSTETRYLEIVSEMVGSDPDKLIEHLKEPIYEPKKSESNLKNDFSLIKARFYLNNVKKYYNLGKSNTRFIHPNTRLSWLTTTLNLSSDSPIEIVTIDRLESEYELINLGSIERNQSATFNSKISAQYGVTAQTNGGTTSGRESKPTSGNTAVQNIYDANGNLVDSSTTSASDTSTNTKSLSNSKANGVTAGVGGEVGYANTEAIKEAFNIAYNEFKTGFSFESDNLTISQKGRMFSDISNSVIVSATLKPKSPGFTRVHTFKNLFKKNIENSADELIVTDRAIKYIPCDSTNLNLGSEIKVSYDGLLRTAENDGEGNNRLEYDDLVKYYVFKSDSTKNINTVVIDLSEYCKKVYELWALFEDGSEQILKINNPLRQSALFLEDEIPLELYKWILMVVKNPTKAKLETNKFSMYFDGEGNTEKTYLVNFKMQPDDITKLGNLKELYFKEFEVKPPKTKTK